MCIRDSDRGTARTDKRKCDARNRHDSHRHTDIFKNLEEKHSPQTDDDEITVRILRAFRDADNSVHEYGV